MVKHWFSIDTWKWKPAGGLDLGGTVEPSQHCTDEAGSYPTSIKG
jgi:hypothetical protein